MVNIPLGPFVLQSPIQRGGMGEVWRGVHKKQGIPVAIKVMTGSRARQRRYRDAFRNEVCAVAALNHPGIVKVFDHGMVTPKAEELSSRRLVAGSPYLVMELASRGSLDQIRGVLSWGDLKNILITLLDALAHAHARGVVHRDLKPGNVLLASEDDLRPGLKLTDFGLAHAADESRTKMKGSRAGTPRYMAPELFEGHWRDYGPWSDLYALGCLAYELSSNKPMFPGKTYQDLKRQHLYEPPQALEPLQPIPGGFESWALRLVQKKQHERFERAADAAWALLKLGDPDGDTGSVLATDFSMSAGSTTNMFSTMSGFGMTTTLMFPDMHGAPDQSTLLFPEEGLPNQSTYLLDKTIERADTYLFPELGLAGANTYIFGQGKAPPTPVSRSSRGREVSNPVNTDLEPVAVVPPPHPLTWRRSTPNDTTSGLVGAGLQLFALRTYRMVGREAERDAIWDALTEVRKTAKARLILLSGPAGYGKSRLTEWIGERAHELGSAELMRASHSPIGGPANGLPRMMARYLGCVGLSRADVRRRARKLLQAQGVEDDYEWDALTELMMAPMAEERVARAKPIRFASPTERYVLIQRMIGRIGQFRPCIVWLDDVQWGSDALWFAQFILKSQTLTSTPVLFLLTARDDGLAERPVETDIIDQLLSQPNTKRIPVGPLSAVVREQLVHELLLLEGDLAKRVADRSRGNPLFAVQLVGDWVQRGVLEAGETGFVLREGEEARFPDDLHEVWTTRVARLLEDEPSDSGPALEVASLLGQEVDSLEWEAACREAGLELTFHLYYKLLSARLAQPQNDTWAFTHGMLRECLERNARETGRWSALHRACARMLSKRYPKAKTGVAERLGRHLLAAGDLAHAIAPLMRGAQEHIEASEFRIAEELLRLREEALKTLEIEPSAKSWGEGWILQLQLGIHRGELQEAGKLANQTVALSQEHGWKRLLPDALIHAGQVALLRTVLDAAKDNFDEALTLVRASEDARREVDCLRGLGQVAFLRGNIDEAMDLLRSALVQAKKLKDLRRVADCLQALRPVVIQKGDVRLGVDLIRQARSLNDRIGNRHGVGECLFGLGEIAISDGQLDKAETFYQRALTLFERLGAQGGIASCLLGLAEVDQRRTRLGAAEERFRQVIQLHEASGVGDAIRPRLGLSHVLIGQGRFNEAGQVLLEAKVLAESAGRNGLLVTVHAMMLLTVSKQRDWESWPAHVATVEELLVETQALSAEAARDLMSVAEAASTGDRDDLAAQVYELVIVQWHGLGDQGALEAARAARADLELEEGAEVTDRVQICPECLRRYDGEFNFCIEDGGKLIALGLVS